MDTAAITGMLSGIRVLDFTRAFSGPLTTMLLGSLGADVIKVEHPDEPDETRTWSPFVDGTLSTYFSFLNRNKRSVHLDLKHEDAAEIVRRLVLQADVVIENFTPGVAARLGIDYDTLAHIDDRIVYCSISGFGQTGPYRERRGYDPVLQAMGGLMGVTGERGGGPIKSMIPVADYTSGLYAAFAIAAALAHRERTGTGEYLDIGMLDVMVNLTSTVGSAYLLTGKVPPRSGTENPVRVPSAAFACGDGVYLQLVPNQSQWRRFCDVVGHPDWTDDPRFADNAARIANQDTLYPALREVFASRPSREWLRLLLAAGIAVGPINTLDMLFEDPQVIARDMVHKLERPGVEPFRVIRTPIVARQAPARPDRYPPWPGEQTEQVLHEVAHLDAEEIARLTAPGAAARHRRTEPHDD